MEIVRSPFTSHNGNGMPATLECLVDRRTPYTLVRLIGALDVAGATRARAALLKVLAEQPDAVVVDMAGIERCLPSALSIFRAVARKAARWPSVPILLAAPIPLVAAAIARSAAEGMPLFPTVAAAATKAGWGPASPTLVDDLLPVSGAARRARELVTEACVRWDLPELTGPACIAISELVNNGVEHAGTMLTARVVLRERYLHVAVHDGSTAPPVPRPVDLRGRGLHLVASVAHSWGYLETADGKVVWATFARGRPA
jgi:anti-sigma regulatory factor (Ser/Thr protein kinase)